MDAVSTQRHIDALSLLGRAMASTADYEQALATLIRTISEILDVETAGFMMHEPERAELVLQEPAFGFADSDAVRSYRVALRDGGNAVKVFLSGEPYVSNAPAEDPRMLQRYVALFAARNIATVPLMVEDRPIGVCHAINRRNGGFTGDDVELFARIAPLLAVSVQSAGMFRDLRIQRHQLERAILLQRELTRTAFEAPGMRSMAERLADLIDRPVMVLDPDLRPLASTRWPAEVAPTPSWLEPPTLGSSPADTGPAAPTRPRIVPIAVGQHLGGHLAVLDGPGPVDEIDARAIEHAASTFAVEMLRQQTSFEVEARLKGDLLQELVSGQLGDEEAARLLGDLDSRVRGPWRVVAVAARWRSVPHRGRDRWVDEVQAPDSRLYLGLQQLCRELLGSPAVVPWRSRFLVLLPATPDDPVADADLARELQAAVRAEVEVMRPGSRVLVATSSAILSARGFGQAVGEAERALEVARVLNVLDRPLIFEHLGVYRILLGGGRQQERDDFVAEALGPLREHDRSAGSELEATLRCYVDSDYNAAEAARRLYVHTNTLGHRLGHIRRLLGGDPARGDLRLQVELALKLGDLSLLGTRAAIGERAGRTDA
jgi:hypothetical protein